VKRLRLLAVMLLLAGASAAAAKDLVSAIFHVDKPKPLAGVLTDNSGAELANQTLQLLDGQKKLIKALMTNSTADYDFGTLQPGDYRVRVKSATPWCQPEVVCDAKACKIKPLKACVRE
jgi:hypothetical protein